MEQVSPIGIKPRGNEHHYAENKDSIEREKNPGGAAVKTEQLWRRMEERGRERWESIKTANRLEEEERDSQDVLESLKQEAKETRTKEEERKESEKKWEQGGWGTWDYVEQGWHEIGGEWKLVFTTNSGRREWLEEDERRRTLVEGREVIATPKWKREKEDGRSVKGGEAEVGTPEKKQCLRRRKGGGESPEL